MPTITEIRTAGTDLTLVPRPIYEPLNAPDRLASKLDRFGDHYDLSSSSNLYRFLLALCGESGAGQIKKQMLYPRLQSSLTATSFSDLDRLYGNPLGLPRMSSELYSVDPRNEALTQDQWIDVRIKDAQYRARCLLWMRAILSGPTPDGIKLAAEAACGIDCDVVEQYIYLENQASDHPTTMTNWGSTNSPQEFVIVPQAPSISLADHRRIIRLVERIKPVNSICTIAPNNGNRTEQTIQGVEATSEGFNVRRLVTGRADIDWPAPDPSKGLWITTGEQEAPTFAFMDSQETVTYLTVIDATASSEHIGPFNKQQRELFGHLNYQIGELQIFDASKSFQKAFAPIQLTVPWTAST